MRLLQRPSRMLSSSLGVTVRFVSSSKNPRVLITGGLGQIGTDLSIELRKKFGAENVIVTDINKAPAAMRDAGPFEYLDVLDRRGLENMVVTHNVDWLIHLSAIMSVLGEQIPHKAMDLNIDGLRNALEVSRLHKLRVFVPSTMAVFGSDAGKVMTKDDTILNPTTVYGIPKFSWSNSVLTTTASGASTSAPCDTQGSFQLQRCLVVVPPTTRCTCTIVPCRRRRLHAPCSPTSRCR